MKFQVIVFLFFSLNAFAQDAYHISLKSDLQTNFNLEGGSFVFLDSEEEIIENLQEYGSALVSDVIVDNMDFTVAKNINITSVENNPWDAGMGMRTTTSISNDDLILVTFWARELSSSSQLFMFVEETINFEKELYVNVSFTPDWTQYYLVFKASSNYNIGRLQMGFHFGSQAQNIEIAGFNAINYEDNYEVDDLPSSFSPFNYDGREDDAPWRALAQSRIESLRKADIDINVIDSNGNPLSNAVVNIDMTQHDFGFGSALVTCRFPGNNCYDETYVDKVINLDGRGHGFNECVNENALKWRGWEQEWLGTPEETVDAFEWLHNQGIRMRGHNLFWPGSDYLPDDINENVNDIDYVRTRIDNRIDEMINHPELSLYVRDWDVLNEITTNRTLENSFNGDPTLDNGRKLYNEIFNKVKAADSDLEMYINDFMAISSGSANLVARYKSFLDELRDDEVPFDGIGFQCHIGTVPNGIPQVEQIFNEFYQRYGKRMKVTEYDINDQVDEQTQADYMRDLLTLTFSHPGMDAFVMWGFWDGNHWKQNAPMYNLDWSIKPSGEVFIDKVFNEWWTNEEETTGEAGLASFTAFKGKHTVTISHGTESITQEIELLNDSIITIQLDGVTSTTDLKNSDFNISPSPVQGDLITLSIPESSRDIDMAIYDLSGKLVMKIKNVQNGQQARLDIPAGSYNVQFELDNTRFSKLLIKI
jgi:GH35 family endo-1,4-beta-xylanase